LLMPRWGIRGIVGHRACCRLVLVKPGKHLALLGRIADPAARPGWRLDVILPLQHHVHLPPLPHQSELHPGRGQELLDRFEVQPILREGELVNHHQPVEILHPCRVKGQESDQQLPLCARAWSTKMTRHPRANTSKMFPPMLQSTSGGMTQGL
jgi:hypothetical protein